MLRLQDDPEDILESHTALLPAQSFRNTPPIPSQKKTDVSVILCKLWSVTGASYRCLLPTTAV